MSIRQYPFFARERNTKELIQLVGSKFEQEYIDVYMEGIKKAIPVKHIETIAYIKLEDDTCYWSDFLEYDIVDESEVLKKHPEYLV